MTIVKRKNMNRFTYTILICVFFDFDNGSLLLRNIKTGFVHELKLCYGYWSPLRVSQTLLLEHNEHSIHFLNGIDRDISWPPKQLRGCKCLDLCGFSVHIFLEYFAFSTFSSE